MTLSPLEAGLLVLAFAALVAAVALGVRARRVARDAHEVWTALEDLRAGEAGRRTEIGRTSPLAVAGESVNRLAIDLAARRAEADAAAERWRALSDAALDLALLTTDTDGDIRSFSAGATRLFGWEEGEVMARPAAILFEEASYKDLLPKLARRSLRTQGISTRARLLRRDGRGFPAEVAVRMLLGPREQPQGFMMVVRDATEQARLEGDLRQSEQRFRGLVEGMAVAALIVRDGKVLYANPEAAALLGRTAPELAGTLFRERVVARDVLVVEEALGRLAQAASGRDEWSCSLTAEGGGRRDVRVVASVVEFEGRPALLLLLHDESATVRTTAEIARNEAMLDAVLEAAADGILVCSGEAGGGGVQMVNRAFLAMVGLDGADVLGQEAARVWERLRAAGDAGTAVADHVTSGVPGELYLALGRSEEGPRSVCVRAAVLRGRSGERFGTLVVSRDLTEQKRSERRLEEQAERLRSGRAELEDAYRKLHEAHAALGTRGADLDRLNQELRRLDEMKSNLLANVSHELQTPLVSIRGYTEMVLRERLGPINDEQRKGLALSLKSIDRLIAMIDNLLAFARTDPGEARLELTHFPLRPLIDEALDLLRADIAAKGLEVSVEMEDDETRIHGDRDRLLEVLLNLLSNAVKFNRPQGAVDIRSRAGQSGYAAVTIRDTGVGIPQESIGRIFDRHYRVERAGEAATAGSGLGLSIVRDLLRLHGCTIHVDSEEGKGTAFTFTLPLGLPAPEIARVREPEPEPDAAPAPAPRPAEGTPPRLRIIRRFRPDR